jgi:Na/Pi-cotransporter
MYGTLTFLDLAGAVALLLWGVHMVQTGVQRAFGSEFRRILSRGFGGRLQAFTRGLGVTAVLQSSTATALMITSFAAGGFIALVPALAAMLGANVGTTLIVQVLSFNVSALSPLLLLVGVIAFRAGSTRTRDLGRVAIGLGLMLIALSRLLEVVAHYEDVPNLRMFMTGIAMAPMSSALVGVVMAWAAHSSVAVALLVMSLTGKGILPLNAAIALMIGANIRDSDQPAARRFAGRECRRTPCGRWQSGDQAHRRRGRHAAHSLDRADAGSHRTCLAPCGCGLSCRLQHSDRGGVSTAPFAPRTAARAGPAEPRPGRRPFATALSG